MEATEQKLLGTLTERIRKSFNLSSDGKIRCACCKREPVKIPDLKAMAEVEEMDLEEYVKEDGTYSKDLDLFVCDDCFYKCDAPAIKSNLIDSEYSSRVSKITIIEMCLNVMNKAEA